MLSPTTGEFGFQTDGECVAPTAGEYDAPTAGECSSLSACVWCLNCWELNGFQTSREYGTPAAGIWCGAKTAG